jgi:Dienelactone hydrolase family
MIPWVWNHRQSVTIPIVKAFFTELKKSHPDDKIGVAGFGWGGRYAILLSQAFFAGKMLVDAIFAGCPSQLSVPADVMFPMCPVSLVAGSEDKVFSAKTAEKVEKMWEKGEESTEVVVYQGAKHGFCVRGNMKDPTEKEHMEKSIVQVILGGVELMVRRLIGLIHILRRIFRERLAGYRTINIALLQFNAGNFNSTISLLFEAVKDSGSRDRLSHDHNMPQYFPQLAVPRSQLLDGLDSRVKPPAVLLHAVPAYTNDNYP